MRSLLPAADDVDLVDAYAYPEGPWLRANFVASVDGAIAVDGRSRGLSGATDRRVMAVLRDLCDAVVVGAGTARAEGYEAVRRSKARIAWRRQRGLSDVPPIVVVTASLDFDPEHPLFSGAIVRTVILTTQAAARERGEDFAEVADLIATPGESVDMGVGLQALQERGLMHLLCEGGPTLLGHLARSELVDEVCLTVSPLLVGGSAAGLLSGPPLASAVGLRLAHVLEDDGFLFTRYGRRVG